MNWFGKPIKFLRPIESPSPNYPEKVRNNLREGTRRADPLVIDLDGDGIELTDISQSNAMFDLTGSGFANRVGWVGSNDGFKNLLIAKLLELRYNFKQRRVWE